MKRLDIALAALSLHGRVLLQKRREPGGPLDGLWEFPGGKRREGEDFAQAALRELREETGVTATSCSEVGRVWHDYPDRQVALRLFLAERAAGGPVEMTDDRRFFSVEELPALLYRQILRPYLRSRGNNAVRSPEFDQHIEEIYGDSTG